MEAIDVEVVPDSYIQKKMMQGVIIVVAWMTFSILFWAVMDNAIIVLISAIVLSALLMVVISYVEYILRPISLRITDEGVILSFNHLKDKFHPWSRIIEIFVLKQVPKMSGVMPTRGGFMISEKRGYSMNEDAARAMVKAYTEIFGHPPRVKDASDDCVFWAVNSA